jgi:hypothetical protein
MEEELVVQNLVIVIYLMVKICLMEEELVVQNLVIVIYLMEQDIMVHNILMMSSLKNFLSVIDLASTIQL